MNTTERRLMVETPTTSWASMIDETRLMSVRWPSGATVTGLYRNIPSAEHMVCELSVGTTSQGLRPPLTLEGSSQRSQADVPTLSDLRLTLAMETLEERFGKQAIEIGSETTRRDAKSAVIRVPERMAHYTVKASDNTTQPVTTVWATSIEAARTAAAWRTAKRLMRRTASVQRL